MGGKPSETRLTLLLQLYSISGETRSLQNEQNHSPLWGHVCKRSKFKPKICRSQVKGSNMWCHYKCHISHLGDSWRVGMWQVRWKTLGHLSQQRSSPPFWQTAHQSSLGSSSGSAVFSVSGCPGDSDCSTFGALALDRGGVASGGRDFAWAPVLLSGRLEPTVTFTSKMKNKSFVWLLLHPKCLKYHSAHVTVSFKTKGLQWV